MEVAKPTQAQLLSEILSKAESIPLEIRNQVGSFLQKTINGDQIETCVIYEITQGVLAYILTTAKLIFLRADAKGLRSEYGYLSKVVGITRSTLSEAKEGLDTNIQVKFDQGGFGLNYSTQKHSDIDRFFERVDEAILATKRRSSNG